MAAVIAGKLGFDVLDLASVQKHRTWLPRLPCCVLATCSARDCGGNRVHSPSLEATGGWLQLRRLDRAGDRERGWEPCAAASSLARPERAEVSQAFSLTSRAIRLESLTYEEAPMPPYLRLGSIPRKRHTIHPHEPGFKGEGIYYEEVVGLAGFSRAYSIVYHLRPPTRVVRLEPAGTMPADFGDQPSLRHHHVKTRTIPCAGDPITGRLVIFGNDDVTLARCRPEQAAGNCSVTPVPTRWSSFRPRHVHDVWSLAFFATSIMSSSRCDLFNSSRRAGPICW